MKCGAVLKPFVFLLFSSALVAAQPVKSESCPNTICRIVAHGVINELRWPDFVDFRGYVLAFYAPAYGFAWIDNDKPSARALSMIAMLKAAETKGLEPEDYDSNLWEERIAHLDRSQFDVALTVALMRYLADLHYGKANPGFFHLDPKQNDFNVASFLRNKLMTSADPNGLITSEVEPPFEGYKRTERALGDYLAIAREPDIKLSEVAATVEPGSSYSDVQLLAQRLCQLGDLPADKLPKAYEGFIVEAVKHFQARHGIDPDGRLGKATIEQLNIPLTQRIEQLRFSLERWRWIPHIFAHPPVVVNIPEFTLRTLNSAGETDLEMKVVVGSAYDNETPVFAANLDHLTFRPYWNVPRSILVNEMTSKLAEDRTYLTTHRYEVVNAAERVVRTQGDLSDAVLRGLVAGRYRIRQMPGPDCALGLLRFGILNEHNVYLHDTPSQALFSMTRRDFSHGCVRVERPVQLADWCLRDTHAWTPARIRRAMHGPRTFDVKLKNPIPVLLVYATAIVMRNNEVHFALDIYHQDALLENRLSKGYPSRITAQ
jgi:murein L,D-transpeptidase YcbB/YkuD